MDLPLSWYKRRDHWWKRCTLSFPAAPVNEHQHFQRNDCYKQQKAFIVKTQSDKTGIRQFMVLHSEMILGWKQQIEFHWCYTESKGAGEIFLWDITPGALGMVFTDHMVGYCQWQSYWTNNYPKKKMGLKGQIEVSAKKIQPSLLTIFFEV